VKLTERHKIKKRPLFSSTSILLAQRFLWPEKRYLAMDLTKVWTLLDTFYLGEINCYRQVSLKFQAVQALGSRFADLFILIKIA